LALIFGNEFDLVSFDPRRFNVQDFVLDVGVGQGQMKMWGKHSVDIVQGRDVGKFEALMTRKTGGRMVSKCHGKSTHISRRKRSDRLGNVNTYTMPTC
jgi:hypothetical protein